MEEPEHKTQPIDIESERESVARGGQIKIVLIKIGLRWVTWASYAAIR